MKINGRELTPKEAARRAHTGEIDVPHIGMATKGELSEYYQELNRLGAPRTEEETRKHNRQLSDLASLLRSMATAMVREPEEISVRVTMREGIYLYTLFCDGNDIPMLRGKRNITLSSLKRILQVAGRRIGVSTDLVIAGFVPRHLRVS